ncbi:phenylacetate-CoA oxygenase subunit PaaI [Cupriavidus basilensis]|uniref:Phenylacetate-CoA oxygenase subunit PaaI n=1 Tax=Cupriavidus basilensis TaxID=68895 RepID=A0ABT6ARX6_9BURK|nr:Phenylacetic acid catabolic protein [Cupriavidus basilensis]MDF3835384.1 phenylacetate-CoA oxygenase subunit PaaI [Cupriavidus basilensis]
MTGTAETIKVRAARHSVQSAEAFHQMPNEYQALATHLMLVHTEGELTGADDYTRIFYPLAPTALEKFVCCERAAEEMNHYMLGAAVLQELGIDTSHMLGQDMMERPLYPNELVRGVETWMERGIFSFLGEAVVLDHLLEFAESSYQPFAKIFIDQIIKDEHIHVAHGYRIVKQACEAPAGRAAAQEALNRFWPIVLDLCGKTDSVRTPLYVEWGLRQTTNAELRDRFIRKTRPRLQSLGLAVPDDLVNRRYL